MANAIDITSWSDDMVTALLEIKAGQDVLLEGFTRKQARLLFEAAGIEAPAYYFDQFPTGNVGTLDGPDYEGRILDRADARDGDYL